MKRVFLAAALLAGLASVAVAQVYGPGTGSGGPGTPGGTPGQIQYNNGGAFGGFTQGGDCTTDTSTGLTTCLTLNSVAPGSLYAALVGAGLDVSTGTLNLTQASHDDTGSGTAIISADLAKTVLLGNHTYTLAQAGTAGFTSGWGTCLLASAGPATINATTSVFSGASGTTQLVLQTGQWACPASDGANYFTISNAYPAATVAIPGVAKLHNVPLSTGWIATVNPNKAVIATIHQASRISAIIGRVSDATGGTATVQVFKAPSGTACSAGTALTSDTLNANGTANTNQTLTLVGGATDDLADGDSLCLVTTGTTAWTTGVGIGGITVYAAPI
jgi:hypothetical protein